MRGRPAYAALILGALAALSLVLVFSPQSPLRPTVSDTNDQAKPDVAQPSSGSGKAAPPPEIAGTVITSTQPEATVAALRARGFQINRTTPLSGGRALLTVSAPALDPATQALGQLPGVSAVAPNYRYRALDTPTDPRYADGSQWNLPKVSAPAAWDITTGASTTVVAVIDTGVLFSQTVNATTYTQPDFPTSRRWVNSGENCGSTDSSIVCAQRTDGVDNDGNGKPDDVYGWDFMGGWRGARNAVGTVTITIASPGVLTRNNHGLVNDDIVYLTTTGALPTGLLPSTLYYVAAATTNTFSLSATKGGAAINTSGTQSGTHTLHAIPASTCLNYSDSPAFNSSQYPGYVTGDNDPQPYSCDNPDNTGQINKDHYNNFCGYGPSGSGGACYIGHGTMVASVIAAQTNNGQLIAGIDRAAKVMNLRVLDGYGFGDTAQITAAVDYARAKGAHVINMSLGLCVGCSDPTLEAAMSAAKTAGVVIVAASGNDGTNGVYYPASSPHVIAVGATDQNDNRASFSSYGTDLDVVAPGVSVPVANAPSSAPGVTTNYALASGTSLATPHVAGEVALIRALRPGLTVDQITTEIRLAIDKPPAMGDAGFSNQFGYGRINLYRAAIGSLQWQMVSQSSSTGSFALTAGSSATFTLTVKNTGQATWTNSSNPIKLATWNPSYRTSVFNPGTWESPYRAATLSEASVAPNSNGTFVFAVKAPSAPGFYVERFNLIAEGLAWFPDPWMEFDVTVTAPSYTWQMVSQTSSTGSFELLPGSTATFTLVAKNTGNVTWTNTGNPVRLATWEPSYRTSAFYDSSWVSPTRAATLQEASVAPGANGTFIFAVRTPVAEGFYVERFNLVMEGVAWFTDPWMEFDVSVKRNLTWQMVSQSSSTGSFAIPRNTAATFTLVAKNTGNVTWTNTGNPVRLATWEPSYRTSLFQHAAWISSVRVVNLTEASVAPGANGTFTFQVQTPNTPGFYVERFNLVMEGVAWFTDPWMEFDVVVQ